MGDPGPRAASGALGRAPGQSLAIDVGRLMSDRLGLSQSDLITRPTGRAVREAIEERVADCEARARVALVDLAGVRVMDFSCADEVVAKLLLRSLDSSRSGDPYFIFRGHEHLHGHAVAEVLSRRGLAAVCAFGGDFRPVGAASGEQRALWSVLEERGSIALADAGSPLSAEEARLLGEICDLRLAHLDSEGGATALSLVARASEHHNHQNRKPRHEDA